MARDEDTPPCHPHLKESLSVGLAASGAKPSPGDMKVHAMQRHSFLWLLCAVGCLLMLPTLLDKKSNVASVSPSTAVMKLLSSLQSKYALRKFLLPPPPSPKYYAVVIETNPPYNLVPVTLHFAHVLGPKWTVLIYTMEQNWVMPTSLMFQRAVQAKEIEIRFLPPESDFSDGWKFSAFLASPWLWERLLDAAHVLMFQLDSILCSNSEVQIEDFLEYDFIGAPISEQFGRGYNGGLSLRNPRLFLNITREEQLNTWEDQFFYAHAEARVKDGVNLPSAEVAQTFAVETIFYEKPLGYHQATRWQPDRMDEIRAWCPEIGMAGEKRTPI